MHVNYDLNKIKFATDEATFTRAVGLYESGKVTDVETLGGYYSAAVLGTEPYRVSISARNYKLGHCTCYLGQKDTLCKHMIALALYAVMDGKLLLRLDRKLRIGGVDDSNGIVCGFMTQVVEILEEYTRINPDCINAFKSLIGIGITCFQWEEPLIRIWDEKTAAEYNEKKYQARLR